jgi:parvulin-like peptidyl-prolyl isomerase
MFASISLLILLGALLILAVSCTNEAPDAGVPTREAAAARGHADPETVVATVNGEEITRGDLLRRIRAARGDVDPESMGPNQWQRLVEEALDGELRDRLLANAARTDGMTITPEELEQALARTREIMGEEEFEKMLSARETTEEEYGKFLEQRLLADRYKAGLLKDVAVDEGKVSEYYEGHPDAFAIADSVKLQMMILETLAAAETVHTELAAGADFDELGRQYAVGYEKGVGGLTRWIPYEMLPEEVGPRAREAEPGELLAPIDAGSEIFVIRVVEKRQAGPLSLDEVGDEIRTFLRSREQGRILDDWYESARSRADITFVR